MERPFILIDAYMTTRAAFLVEEGFQPTDAVMMVTKGKFLLEMDGQEKEVGPGDVVILPTDQPFRRKILEPPTFLYFKFRRNPRSDLSLPLPYGKVAFTEKGRLAGVLDLWRGLEQQSPAVQLHWKEHLLEDILFLAYAEHRSMVEAQAQRYLDDPCLTRALNFMEEHLREKIALQDLCRAAGCSAAALTRRFQQVWGLPPMGYLNQRRLAHARDLLLTTAYPIREIAARCGFANEYYFSTAFKRAEGCPPRTFRRNGGSTTKPPRAF